MEVIVEIIISLIILCPFVAVLYVLDQMKDGKSQEFTQKNEPVKYVTPEQLMLRNTYIRALDGDWRAREWLTKNFFDTDKLREGKKKKPQKPKPKKQNTSKKNTTPNDNKQKLIVSEAVSALIGLGHSPVQAKLIIQNKLSEKVYKSTEELITDVYR
jgi:hypothetical protein